MSLPESSETPLQQLKLNKDSVSPCLKEAVINADGVSACNNNHNLNLEIEDRLKLPDDSNDSGIVENDSNNSGMNGVIDKSKSNCCQPGSKFPSSADNECENQAQTQGSTNHIPVTNFESDSRVMECNTSTSNDCGSNVSQISPLSESDLVIDCDGTGNSGISSKDNCNKSVDVEQLIDDIESTSLLDRSTAEENDIVDGISYVVYKSETQMPDIMRLITKDLSEPYSIYTYRYFIHNWPKLCFLAMDGDICIGAIVCKLDLHKKMVRRGYIAMLAVDSAYRRRKLGSTLVTKAIKAMISDDCDEVVLETEITNQAALRLYENLGFVRDKRLFRYYLNGVDALRLKLWLR